MIARNLIITGVTIIAFCGYSYFMYNSKKTNTDTNLTTTATTNHPDVEANSNFKEGDKIQLALILDTSNSMDGLIDQAKSQLWKMVNELAGSDEEENQAQIEIALYQYGNDILSMSKGYVQQVVPLTSDMDAVSEKLFELSTNGGQEYCGFAINRSLSDLAWSKNDNDYKAILIAGNEGFNQGPVSFQEVCSAAKDRDILINTIYCGEYNQGINLNWKKGANLANGSYMVINTADQVVHITTPYDSRIQELNRELNNTYISYGSNGAHKLEVLKEQDNNAQTYGSANSRTRALFKSKKQYKNEDWDLVDLHSESEDEEMSFVDEIEINSSELKELSKEELKKHLVEKSEERKRIKEELSKLDKDVKQYIKQEKDKNQKEEKETLDNKLIKTIKEQMDKKKNTK